jgi:aminoglycoside phosphotransferase (APT) family kinase protein
MENEAKRPLDEPGTIRSGEELDGARVLEFVGSSLPDVAGEITVRQFPGGFSNLTYLVTVGARDFILRRPPFGRKAKGAHDMGREYRVLSALKLVFPCCPAPVLYTDDESVIGAPFYLMERINGIILRRDLPAGLDFTPAQARALSENLVTTLSCLHSVDPCGAGLEDLGKGDGYVLRQVEGWSRRYADARTDDAPTFDGVIRWLHDKLPQDFPSSTIIHNDYKFDNTVLNPADPTEIIGLLDWEMATIGDPLMDLGASLAYWVERDDPPELQAIRTMPTNLPGTLTRKEQVALYGSLRGIAVDNFDFYYCFGLFRLAVIVQQIYYRYFHGQTRDPRFKGLIHAVHSLERTAQQVVGKSDL